jgi:hypothetical protein
LDSAGSVIAGEDPQSLTAATKVGLFSIGKAEWVEKLIIDGKTVPLRQNSQQ